MAITLVQHAQNTGTSVTSLTVTLGANTTAGNCLVVAIVCGNSDTVSSVKLGGAAGNFSQVTSATDTTGSGVVSAIWVDPNCAGGQTAVAITVTSSVTGIRADVYEFSGLATSSVVDKSSAFNPASTSSSWTSNATATTTQAVEAWVGVVAFGSGVLTGPSAPWTNETQQGGGTSLIEMSGYQITSSTGAATYSGTSTTTDGYAACVVTLLPAPTPATPRFVLGSTQAVKRAAHY